MAPAFELATPSAAVASGSMADDELPRSRSSRREVWPTTRLSTRWNRAATRALAHLDESHCASPISTRQLNLAARRAARLTLREAQPRFPALAAAWDDAESLSADLLWTDDAHIRGLNRDGRGLDRATDVLSYPTFEAAVSASAEFGDWPFQIEDEFASDGELSLGDLVISVETAARQARELKHSLEEETAFLVVHGTLHLLGYDHDSSARRRAMWKIQESVFETWRHQYGRESQPEATDSVSQGALR